MKSLIMVGFLVATLLQVEGRSIGRNDESPKVFVDSKEQFIACRTQLGPIKLAQLPPLIVFEQLPEDNAALNELWGCVWKKKGIIDDDAVLNEDKLEEYLVDTFSMFAQRGLELPDPHNMVQQCKDVHGIGYGQTALKIDNCIIALLMT